MQSIKIMFRSPRFVTGFLLLVIVFSYAILVPVFNTADPKESRAANPVYEEVKALQAALHAEDADAVAAEIAALRSHESADVLTMLDEVEYMLVSGPVQNAISATSQLSKRRQKLVYTEMDLLGELLTAGDIEAAEAEEARLLAHCAEAETFSTEITAAAAEADFEKAAALIEAFTSATAEELVNLQAAVEAADAEALVAAAAEYTEQHAVVYNWVVTVRERLDRPGFVDALAIVDLVQPTYLIEKNTPPNSTFWFGTDVFSRDIFLEMAYGARSSLLIGFVAGCVATFIGITLGLCAGYIGGRTDNIITAFTNIFIVIPTFIILVLISIAVGMIREGWKTGVIIGLTSWPWTARAVRAQTTSLRNRDHVNMARITGYSTMHIITTEIVPYIASYVVMAFILQMAGGIMGESTLAILGLADPTGLSLGRMMNWALNYDAIVYGRWWQFVPVSVAIGMTTFGLYMMNSGMDEVFNPKIRS